MQKLENETKLSGTGMPGLTADLIERTEKKAIYLRSDGCYEIFKIKKEKAREMFGKQYPDREVYPGNEDFGKTAWCFSNQKNALEKYNQLK